MQTPENKNSIITIALQGLFWIAVYVYLLLRVRPALYFQIQEPVFYTGWEFFRPFLAEPGGLLRYVSDFAAQAFLVPWLGALLVTAALFLVSLIFRDISRLIDGNNRPLFYLLPAVLLLVLHNNDRHELTVTLGVPAALAAAWLYLRLAPRSQVTRLMWCAGVSIVFYYIAGGPLLLFAVMTAVPELLQRRYPAAGLAVVTAALIPWLTAQFLVLFPVFEAYTVNLTGLDGYMPFFAIQLTWLFLPLSLLLDRFFKLRGEVLQYAGIFILAAVLSWLTFNRDLKLVLTAEQHARTGEWGAILKMARRQTPNNQLFENLFFRALFHTKRLPYDIFHYPAYRGANLFLNSDLAFITPLQMSDLYFDLGLINEAQHWAFEAQTLNGMTPWVAKRLAQVNIVKGEKRAAAMFVSIMEKSLLLKKTARRYRRIIKNPQFLAQNKKLEIALIYKSSDDFVTTNQNPLRSLESLVESNPNNRMALEYLLTYYLLSGQVDRLVDNLPRLNAFKYPGMPVLYQQALCLYAAMRPKEEIDIPGVKIPPDFRRTMGRFQSFMKIYHSGASAVQKQLRQNYGNTYWYYLLYDRRQKGGAEAGGQTWKKGGAQ